MTPEPMSCNELVELVTAYLDGSLDPTARSRFDMHLLDCDGCESYLQQFQATINTLGKIGNEHLDAEFRSKLMAAFRDWH